VAPLVAAGTFAGFGPSLVAPCLESLKSQVKCER